ncbi:MAG: TetR/AcrR family transcriptional regulator [Pseudomonadales bacterium]
MSSTDGTGWQAQKSAMTRQKILDATLECFIRMGYSNVTTGNVIQQAGISRGTMLHHFPSKKELIQAAVEFLHDKLIDDFSQRVSDIPKALEGADRRRAGLDAYWDYLTGDLAVAYHEMCVAGYRDPELGDILQRSQVLFEQHTHEKNMEQFAEWFERGELYYLAMDITKFLMEGMAYGQLKQNKEEKVRQLIDYLSDRLEEIFEEGGSTAANRHSGKTRS